MHTDDVPGNTYLPLFFYYKTQKHAIFIYVNVGGGAEDDEYEVENVPLNVHIKRIILVTHISSPSSSLL
jgi:hypothetical protein